MEAFYTSLVVIWAVLLAKSLHASFFTPTLSHSTEQGDEDSVDILVPVRNESCRDFSGFLEDIGSQRLQHHSIYITDDRSTDSSAEMVLQASRRHRSLHLLHGQDPPSGWTGKTHALMQGKRAGSGKWLALVDADIRLNPDTVARAIATANETCSSAVCVLPRFVYRSFWVRVVLPTMIWLSIMRVSPPESNSNLTRSAFGFGNFILVTREAHDRIGGFESYKDSVLDDCALFEALKSNGELTLIVDGASCIESEMYRNLSELILGFSKNSFASVGYSWAMVFITLLLILASLVAVIFIDFGQPLSWAFVVPMALTACTLNQRLDASIATFPFFPIGLAISGWILLLSAIKTGKGKKGIPWKGRLVK